MFVCLLQNMGLKETQEFPSPEQFVRNNYGKFTHHTEPNIPNIQTVTNPDQEKGTARRAMPRRWISWRVLSEVSFRSANVFFFIFFCISIYLLYWRKPSVCWVDLSAIFGALLIKCFHIMGAFDLWWFKDWQRTYLQQISNQFQTLANNEKLFLKSL